MGSLALPFPLFRLLILPRPLRAPSSVSPQTTKLSGARASLPHVCRIVCRKFSSYKRRLSNALSLAEINFPWTLVRSRSNERRKIRIEIAVSFSPADEMKKRARLTVLSHPSYDTGREYIFVGSITIDPRCESSIANSSIHSSQIVYYTVGRKNISDNHTMAMFCFYLELSNVGSLGIRISCRILSYNLDPIGIVKQIWRNIEATYGKLYHRSNTKSVWEYIARHKSSWLSRWNF